MEMIRGGYLKRFHRIIAGALATVLLLLQCSEVVMADPYDALQSSYDTYVTEAEARLLEVEQRGASSTMGQYGLLTDLTTITEYAMYTDFLMENKDTFGLGSATIEAYENKLNTMMVQFNNTYKVESSK